MQCLNCGMHVGGHDTTCPKCDNDLTSQHNGSTVTIDIAHQGETVREAMRKLDAAIDRESQGYAQYLRVVVGTGLIREEVTGTLYARARSGRVADVEPEPGNRGAILIKLKS